MPEQLTTLQAVRRTAELSEPAPRTQCRQTSRPARWGSEPPPRSGAPSHTGLSPATSRSPLADVSGVGRGRRVGRGRDLGDPCRPAGAPSRRGALDRRPQPTVARSDRARYRRRPHRRDVQRCRAGRRSPSSTADGCASFSSATADGALRRRIDEMPNEESNGCCARLPDELRERLPGRGRGRRDVTRLVGQLDGGGVAARDPRSRRARPDRSPRCVRSG